MHLGWSWLGLLAAYFWASSLWWLLDAVLQLTDCLDPHTCLGIAATPVWPGSLRMWRPTSLLVEMDSPNLGLPCGWAESPLPRCPFFWT